MIQIVSRGIRQRWPQGAWGEPLLQAETFSCFATKYETLETCEASTVLQYQCPEMSRSSPGKTGSLEWSLQLEAFLASGALFSNGVVAWFTCLFGRAKSHKLSLLCLVSFVALFFEWGSSGSAASSATSCVTWLGPNPLQSEVRRLDFRRDSKRQRDTSTSFNFWIFRRFGRLWVLPHRRRVLIWVSIPPRAHQLRGTPLDST